MVWFIRRWQKGVKNSGTSDILVSDSEITVGEFVDIAHQTGPGNICWVFVEKVFVVSEKSPIAS